MEHEIHTEHHEHHNTKKKFKFGTWQIATIVFAVISIILIVMIFSGKVTGKVISGETAGKQLAEYLNKQTNGGVEYISNTDKGNLYEVKVKYQDQEIPVYITKDGKYFIQGAVDMTSAPIANSETNTQNQPSADIPKTDKPKVELFVMSHCPYGTQAEKGILPVVKELKDNIDFEIKFVNYAMHPTQGEVEEQLNQYCIQKEQNSKYLDYLSCFLGEGNGEACLKEVKIDAVKLKACTDKTDKEFNVLKNLEDKASWTSGRFPKFMINDADNKKYGVQGSPTLVINGVIAESGRDAQSLLNIICSAFTTQPEGCNTDMTSFGSPGPGFGFDTQGGSASAAGCGV